MATSAPLLTVGEGATVKGELVADDVVINGRIIGRVRGLKVRLTSTARVEGDIIHKTIAIESGAISKGRCSGRMIRWRRAAEAAQAFGVGDGRELSVPTDGLLDAVPAGRRFTFWRGDFARGRRRGASPAPRTPWRQEARGPPDTLREYLDSKENGGRGTGRISQRSGPSGRRPDDPVGAGDEARLVGQRKAMQLAISAVCAMRCMGWVSITFRARRGPISRRIRRRARFRYSRARGRSRGYWCLPMSSARERVMPTRPDLAAA